MNCSVLRRQNFRLNEQITVMIISIDFVINLTG